MAGLTLRNVTPLTVDQLLRALAALGHAHLADPGQRLDSPSEQDRPELLGALLGLLESEAITVVDPDRDAPLALRDLHRGWQQLTGDRDVHRAVLTARLRRTAYDVPLILADADPDDAAATGPAGIAAATLCANAAAELITAQDHVDNGRHDVALVDLDSAEGSLTQALHLLRLLRLHIHSSPL